MTRRWRFALGLMVMTGLVAACSASSDGVAPLDDDEPADDSGAPSSSSGQPSSSSSSSGTAPADAGGDATVDAGDDQDAGSEHGGLGDDDAGSEDGGLGDDDAGVEPDAGEEDAGPPPDPRTLIRLEGRWDRTQPLAPRVAFPGARITLRFHGTGISLRLTEQKSYRSYEGTSQYSVRVDGQERSVLVTQVGAAVDAETRDYPLAAGLPLGEHVVTLVRRTEAEFGSTRVDDVVVDDGSMLAPPARPLRRIEFIGASNLTGYGIEGTRPINPGDPACDHTPSNQNWERAFPALIGARFDAELEAPAYSGKGVFYNSYRPDNLTLGPLYDRAIPSEPTSLYDASQFDAQVVVIDAGGNDYAANAADDYPSVAQIEQAYAALVDKVRAAHPNAHIFCALSPSINDDYPRYANNSPVMARSKLRQAINAVIAARQGAGDQAIELFEFAQAGNEQHMACHFHPSAPLHSTLATALGDRIALRMGW